LKVEKWLHPWNNPREREKQTFKRKEPLMRVNTRKRKKARRDFEQMYGKQEMIDRMYRIISQGKRGLDAFLM
jgi:hypothetical protein